MGIIQVFLAIFGKHGFSVINMEDRSVLERSLPNPFVFHRWHTTFPVVASSWYGRKGQKLSEREANCSSKNGSHKDKRSKTPVISTNQNFPFWATAKSPYSSPVPPRSSSRCGARTPSSMIFLSPNPTSRANQHVKSPFKHAITQKRDFDDSSTFSDRSSVRTPAAELKERTAVATYCVGRVLSKERDKPEQKKVQGKLLKGKLKPLKPVNIEGPSVKNCRGILSETRSYAAPPNRTLTRRRELIQRIPNVHEFLYDRPRTVESIHRTSAASSIDENRELKDDEETPPDTSRLSPVESDVNMPAAPPASMATTYKVVDGMLQPTPTPRNLTELQSTSTRENFLKKGDSSSNFNDNASRRLEPDNTLLTTFEEPERPETPGDKSKNVRFSDGVHPEKAVKDNTQDENIMEVEVTVKSQDRKEKEEKGKKTCKTSDLDDMKKKDNDEDPNGQGGEGSKQNSSEKGTSKVSGTSEGKSEKRNDENKENYGKQNNVDPHTEKSTEEELKIETTQLLATCSEQPKKSGASTPYTLLSSQESSTPSVLNIQTVIHGGSIHHLVGPESPHRSRSPSPSRSPVRSPARSQTSCFVKSKTDKTNKLIRPSSANQQTRKSRKVSKESHSSTETLTARKSKVYFEGEKPPRQSVFVEIEGKNGVSVDLKEERTLTFEEIEAELNSLKEDIEERRKFENMGRISIDDNSDDQSHVDEVNMDLICLPTENEHESVHEDMSDYSTLLDVYRIKCMEVSENCGIISEALTSARKPVSRPRSGGAWRERREHRNTESRRNSFHFERNSSRSNDLSSLEDNCLKHTISDISIADSGYSRASSDVTQKGENSVPRLNLQVEENSDIGQVETERTEDKTLLELVCDELPDVQQTYGNFPEKKKQNETADLEVIANPKEIQKSKIKKKENPQQGAPFAPLCFTVNARPPEGYIYYFAYGADMNPSRISTYIQRNVKNRFWGLLFGFNLVFNKKGSDIEAGAFANIEFNPFCSTEGCIYQITPQELELLDKFVGYPKHYEHLMLPVWMMNSTDTDKLGVAQYCVPAVMYIAQQEWIAKDEEKLSCDYALTQCIKSSDLVTPNYREFLVNKAGPIEIQI
ncbi:uncharacterized protein LOC133173191 isoform X2 [Saccostrea echinata]|uniref:uncharacterized protein LOC133173191 isoform X2 n=1 Tax=Saccostrea echinata TaxID=191078 RepID=UPI002A8413FE|nr:uncharacterized protein LOC133173191 isoform X2 [Saccostrea echinata]